MNKEGRIVDIHIDQPKTASDGLFDIEAHTSKQLRHFCYTVLTFLNSLLADSNFIVQVCSAISFFKRVFKNYYYHFLC